MSVVPGRWPSTMLCLFSNTLRAHDCSANVRAYCKANTETKCWSPSSRAAASCSSLSKSPRSAPARAKAAGLKRCHPHHVYKQLPVSFTKLVASALLTAW